MNGPNKATRLEKALLWGNFAEHVAKAGQGKAFDRVTHGVVAAIEFLPIIGQAASLIETYVVNPLLATKPETVTEEGVEEDSFVSVRTERMPVDVIERKLTPTELKRRRLIVASRLLKKRERHFRLALAYALSVEDNPNIDRVTLILALIVQEFCRDQGVSLGELLDDKECLDILKQSKKLKQAITKYIKMLSDEDGQVIDTQTIAQLELAHIDVEKEILKNQLKVMLLKKKMEKPSPRTNMEKLQASIELKKILEDDYYIDYRHDLDELRKKLNLYRPRVRYIRARRWRR